MNRAPKSWLLPSAFVGYVSLAAAREQSTALSWGALLIPVFVALGLKSAGRRAEVGKLAASITGVRLTIVGVGLFAASFMGPADSAGLKAASALGQALLTAATLLCTARLTPPPGLLQGHPAAHSLDALWLSVVMWTVATSAALFRSLAPDTFPLDPIALDTALVFCALGSLLLLCASLLRTKLLRGLELGVGDRVNAALSLSLAGIIVGTGSGLVTMASSDRVAGATLVVTCVSVVLSLSVSNAGSVTRTVRSVVALLILGTPTALAGSWFAIRIPQHPAAVALSIAVVGMLVGLVARSLATPLGPEGSRWLIAIQKAMDAALHPHPETALRAALSALKRAEPTSKARPEIFRYDPPGMLSVDVAGYLTDEEVEFPEGILDCATQELFRTLRVESIESVQVRKPSVRPLVTWFAAHQTGTATVLMDDSGPVGLLAMPRGKRRSPFTMEEVDLLGRLSERMAGLISVTASLRRARSRELSYRKQAETANEKALGLSEQLLQQQQSDHSEAEARVEVLRATAHGPAAQITRQELEGHTSSPTLCLETPIGIDPVPWAAHAHLHRHEASRPLVIIDCSERVFRDQEPWPLDAESSPWRRAAKGTLVLVHPGALPEAGQLRLSEGLDLYHPTLVVSCTTGNEELLARLERSLRGPIIRLPSLEKRGEDLQALIINELSRLGLTQRGSPYGIERAALHRLIEGRYPGNDAELTGLLAAVAGYAEGKRITLSDLIAVTQKEDSTEPPPVVHRARARKAPRSRHH